MVRPLDFVRNQLRMNPEATYEQVRARAHLEDVKVHQTTYGRARSQLGLSAPKPRRRRYDSEDEAEATPPEPATLTVGPGGVGPSMGVDLPPDLALMVDRLRKTIVEKARYRILMETVLRLFEDALTPPALTGSQVPGK